MTFSNPRAQTVTLREDVRQGTNRPQVDREKGVIRHVKVLGRYSRNDGDTREYSDDAMEQCAKFYEGLGCNLNHPPRDNAAKERGVEEGVGWLTNAQVEGRGDNAGVYADLNILKAHPHSSAIFEQAERRPQGFGLSHNAEGKVQRVGNKNVVESVSRVRSVDVVRNPATNGGLFESFDGGASGGRAYASCDSLMRVCQRQPGAFPLIEEIAPDTNPDEVTGSSDDTSIDELIQNIEAALKAPGDHRAKLKKLRAMLAANRAAAKVTSVKEDEATVTNGDNPSGQNEDELLSRIKRLNAGDRQRLSDFLGSLGLEESDDELDEDDEPQDASESWAERSKRADCHDLIKQQMRPYRVRRGHAPLVESLQPGSSADDTSAAYSDARSLMRACGGRRV